MLLKGAVNHQATQAMGKQTKVSETKEKTIKGVNQICTFLNVEIL